MQTVPSEVIAEIAQFIDSGEVVYMHRTTHELLNYPDTDDDEFDFIKQKVFDIVDMAPDEYVLFKPLNSSEGYQVMANFAEQIAQNAHKDRLRNALNARRPFRAFRDEVDNIGIETQWYDFKDAYLCVWVQDLIDLETEQ